jgi:hypothetical protein
LNGTASRGWKTLNQECRPEDTLVLLLGKSATKSKWYLGSTDTGYLGRDRMTRKGRKWHKNTRQTMRRSCSANHEFVALPTVQVVKRNGQGNHCPAPTASSPARRYGLLSSKALSSKFSQLVNRDRATQTLTTHSEPGFRDARSGFFASPQYGLFTAFFAQSGKGTLRLGSCYFCPLSQADHPVCE